MGSAPLKRVGSVARAAMILVAVSSVTAVVSWLVGLAVVGDAEEFLDGEMSTNDFAISIAPWGLVALIQGVATLAGAVLVMVWMQRVAKNHQLLHRTGTWGPGWAIGGWFLPPLLYVIPFLMFRELWKASDPDVPLGGDWKSGPVSWLVAAWFVVYGPLSIVAQFAGGTSLNVGGSERDIAEQIVDGQTTAAVSGLVALASGVLFILMARGLTARHQRLIGERPG
jgi:zinc transporter ZupT